MQPDLEHLVCIHDRRLSGHNLPCLLSGTHLLHVLPDLQHDQVDARSGCLEMKWGRRLLTLPLYLILTLKLWFSIKLMIRAKRKVSQALRAENEVAKAAAMNELEAAMEFSYQTFKRRAGLWR